MSGRSDITWPTARTCLVGVIGCPVRHSLSPVLHNAAFRAAGLDWAYVAFEVAAGEGAAAIAGARTLGLRGLSVTMPHKEAAFAAAESADDAVRWLRAANTLVFTDRMVHAHNTDGAGFLAALRSAGVQPAGLRFAILGAGGAARAVALAIAGAGAGVISVWARRPEAASWAAELGAVVVPGTAAGTARDADVVVNATPVGMEGVVASALALDASALRHDQLVVDLVYEPRQTALLGAAAVAGARVMNGLPMLVHQAAGQFELWTGLPASLDAMWEAVGGRPDEAGRHDQASR